MLNMTSWKYFALSFIGFSAEYTNQVSVANSYSLSFALPSYGDFFSAVS